jgi:Fe-S-cluster containining protein
MGSGCTTCSGECCRQYLVHISGRDAVTIARGQALAFEAFIDIVSEDTPTATGFALDGSSDTFALSLRRQSDGACTFLSRPTGGSRRCGIYPDRPVTCAVFPLHVLRGSIDIRADVICEPRGRDISDVDLPLAHATIRREGLEWTRYARVVAAWNTAREGVTERLDESIYFAYVGAAYDAIDHAPAPSLALETILTPIATRLLLL